MTPSMELQFKRKFPRRDFRRAVGILYRGDYVVGTGQEIGEGGLSLMIEREIPIGEEAVISFQIPDGSFISIRVEIRNQENDNSARVFGCLFKNLKFEHKREIRAYVSARQN